MRRAVLEILNLNTNSSNEDRKGDQLLELQPRSSDKVVVKDLLPVEADQVEGVNTLYRSRVRIGIEPECKDFQITLIICKLRNLFLQLN